MGERSAEMAWTGPGRQKLGQRPECVLGKHEMNSDLCTHTRQHRSADAVSRGGGAGGLEFTGPPSSSVSQ